VKKKALTQADVDAAFTQGVWVGWRLARTEQPKKRGRRKLVGEEAFERAWKQWGSLFTFIFDATHNDPQVRALIPEGLSTLEYVRRCNTPEYERAERRAGNRAIDRAAKKFHKDRSTVDRAWRKWGFTAGMNGARADREFDLICRYCTLDERHAAAEADEIAWTDEKYRKLVRLAQARARKSTATK
jgi:hypothetical protein